MTVSILKIMCMVCCLGLAHCNFICMKVVTEMAEVSFRLKFINYQHYMYWYVVHGKLALAKQNP